jgi:hypothetical protein
MPYASYSDVQLVSGLTTDDISNANITSLISYACALINAELQEYHEDEQVLYINNEKENAIDGVNKTFYTKNYPIGDKNNDGTIGADDIYVYTLSSTGVRTNYVVSTISNDEIGKFTLTTAPSNLEVLYLTYYSSTVDMETPHALVKLACAQLASALAFSSFDVKKVSKFRVGKIAVTETSRAFQYFMEEYRKTLQRIRTKDFHIIEGENVL